MDRESQQIAAESSPHVSDYLDQQIESAGNRKSVEDAIGEKMERSSLRGVAQERPPSEDDLSQHREIDADQGRSEEPTVDELLNRKFGIDDKPEKPPQQPQRAEPSKPAEKPFSLESAQVWSEADVQARVTYETQLQRLNDDISEWNKFAEHVSQIADPNMRADYEMRLGIAHQHLNERSSALGRVADQIERGLLTRAQARVREHVEREKGKLVKGFDGAKVRAYLAKHGVSEDALNSPMLSSFELNTAYKAMLYDEMQAQQKPKVIRKVTKVERSRDDSAKLQRAQRTGNYDGIDGALDRRLTEMFER